MVVVQRYTNALASGLIPLMSKLSAGTEMASYRNAQWEFLLGSDEVTTFVAVDDDDDVAVDSCTKNAKLLGCLLRIDTDITAFPAGKTTTQLDDATNGNHHAQSSVAGFGMMLVGPEARGKGLAKLLLNEAMSGEDERRRVEAPEGEDDHESSSPRKLLAVCTKLGQPVYRKLGFSDAGRVTALKGSIQSLKEIHASLDGSEDIRVETYGSLDRSGSEEVSSSNSIDADVRDLIASMDARATGWDRRGRLNKLLRHPPSGGESLRSIAAVATTAPRDGQQQPIAAAVLRQEGPGSPFVIGPMVGSEEAALSLVSTLARAVPATDGNQDEDIPVSIMVSEHPELVDRLIAKGGFRMMSEFPAMALDGRPIYENGDGSYLSLIHPTLG